MAHTAAELREYADEHLHYEIWMASALTERMSRQAALFDEGLSANDGPLAEELLELPGRNADIESFAMHVRNLFGFLYLKRAQLGDVIAAEYFDTPDDWTSARPDRPKSLALINQRAPVEIGHLSFGRMRRKDKTWPYAKMWRDLASVISVFLDKVPDGRVSAEFRHAATALLPAPPTPKTPRELVSDMTRESLLARSRATTAEPYRVPDDPYPHDVGAGTAVMPPKPEPPGFGD